MGWYRIFTITHIVKGSCWNMGLLYKIIADPFNIIAVVNIC